MVGVIKFLESRIFCEESRRGIAFNQSPIVHNRDPVEVHDSIQAMSDRYDSAVSEHRGNHLLHQTLDFYVNAVDLESQLPGVVLRDNCSEMIALGTYLAVASSNTTILLLHKSALPRQNNCL